jgi:chitodextrinase
LLQLATVTSTSYGDSGLTPSTIYRYRIQAIDAAGNVSSNSNTASATTPSVPDVTPPSAPAALSATAAGASQINVAWNAANDNVGVTGYRLERCQGAGCSAFAEIAAPASASFNDTGVVAATSYSYRVRAVDAAGNLGGYSNTASASTSSGTPPPPSAIAFVQGNYATPQGGISTASVKYTAAQTSGDLNVVIVGWSDSRASVTAISDTAGNIYEVAAPPKVYPGAVTQVIYYAKNIVAMPANTNTVTVQFSAAANSPDVRILSYSGLDRTNPLDVSAAATGNNTFSDSGAVTTTSANELLVAGNTVWSMTGGPGAGFVKRFITWPDGDIAQDQVVTSAGSYRATAPLSGGGPWVMQLVTFKAASN